jgi:hypothetical protein
MFVSGGKSLPQSDHLKVEATLGKALTLLANIGLGWKGLPGSNTLAYYELQ